MLRICWIFFLICVPLTAPQAAQFCATNSMELQAHLNTAQTNGADDVIRINTGTYVGNFTYSSIGPGGDATFDVTLDGGYVEFMGTPCGRRQTFDPTMTVLDANQSGRALLINGATGTEVHLLHIGFINGAPTSSESTRGGGVMISGCCTGSMSEVTVENAYFAGNTATFDSALHIALSAFSRIQNSVFTENHAEGGDVTSIVNSEGGGHFIHNTVVGNTSDGDGRSGAYFFAAGTAQVVVANNILWSNDDKIDLRVSASSPIYLQNNSIEDLSGTPTESDNNLNIAPVFQAGPLNFQLDPFSPLVDAGREPPPMIVPLPFEDDWTLLAVDYEGKDRILGQTTDIGAVETTPVLLFRSGFEAQ